MDFVLILSDTRYLWLDILCVQEVVTQPEILNRRF